MLQQLLQSDAIHPRAGKCQVRVCDSCSDAASAHGTLMKPHLTQAPSPGTKREKPWAAWRGRGPGVGPPSLLLRPPHSMDTSRHPQNRPRARGQQEAESFGLNTNSVTEMTSSLLVLRSLGQVIESEPVFSSRR